MKSAVNILKHAVTYQYMYEFSAAEQLFEIYIYIYIYTHTHTHTHTQSQYSVIRLFITFSQFPTFQRTIYNNAVTEAMFQKIS